MSIKQLLESGGNLNEVARVMNPDDPVHEYTPGVKPKREITLEETNSLVDFIKAWDPKIPTDLKSRQAQFGEYYMKVYKEKYIGTAKQNDQILYDLQDKLIP